jgi:galactonate dehydratase
MRIALRNLAGPAATAANLHLAATLPDFTMLEHINDCHSEDLDGGHVVVDSFFPLPHGPGLGVTMNVAMIRSMA